MNGGVLKLRFLVVGGGISGLFLAYYLLKGGHDVVVADSTKGSVRTSANNAGQLSSRPSFTDIFSPSKVVRVSPAERRQNSRWFRLARKQSGTRHGEVDTRLSKRSLSLYEEFFSREKANVDIKGEILDLHSVLREDEQARGHGGRFMTPSELSELGYKGFEGGWLLEERSLHSGKLLDHLASRVEDLGAERVRGEVLLKRLGSRISGAVVEGREVAADVYVVAAGSWSRAICRPLGYDPMVIPARGLALFFRTGGKRVVDYPAHYEDEGATVTQHGKDTIRMTSFFELAGFNPRFSRTRMHWLYETVRSHFSKKCRLELTEAGTGYRPCTPDQLPIVGRIPRCKNGYILSGSCRKGMVLAPVLSQLLIDQVLGRVDGEDPLIQALNPGRFE